MIRVVTRDTLDIVPLQESILDLSQPPKDLPIPYPVRIVRFRFVSPIARQIVRAAV
jgi:hypothetical protein